MLNLVNKHKIKNPKKNACCLDQVFLVLSLIMWKNDIFVIIILISSHLPRSRMISCLSGIRSIFYNFLHMLVHNKMLTKPKTMFTKPKMLLLKATIWNPRILLKPTVWCLICHGYKVVNTKMYRLLAVIKVETGIIASIILSDNWGDLFLLNKFQHCGQSIDRENIPPHRKTINYRYINSQNCI